MKIEYKRGLLYFTIILLTILSVEYGYNTVITSLFDVKPISTSGAVAIIILIQGYTMIALYYVAKNMSYLDIREKRTEKEMVTQIAILLLVLFSIFLVSLIKQISPNGLLL